MTIVNNRVNTEFTANIGQAVRGFDTLAAIGSTVSGVIGSITSMINPMNLAIAGISVGGAISGLSSLSSEFEQTRNTLAGTLAALGVAGGDDPTERFRNGLGLAEQTMARIEASAAALPGEAEDYITVFRAGLPTLQTAVGGSLSDMTEFANRFTAIGRTFGVDAQQISMDIQRMLRAGRGGAGTDVRTFQQMLPFLRTVEGQAGLTADAFNRMTAPERVQLLRSAFAGLQPMLDEAGGTFDSMWGALQSTARSLSRQMGAPIFDGVKEALGEINALFMTGEGELTQFGQDVVLIGQNISRFIVDGVRAAVAGIREMGRRFREFAESPVFQAISDMAGRLVGAATRLAGVGGAGGVASGAGAGIAAAGLGAAVATGPGALVAALAAGLGNFLTRTEAVTQVFGQLVDIASTLSGAFGPVMAVIPTVGDLFGDLIQGVLPGVLSAFQAIAEPLVSFWSGLMLITDIVLRELNPVFESLFNAVGNLFQAIGSVLAPVMTIVGRIFLALYEVLAFLLTPVIEAVVGVFAMLIDAIASFVTWLGGLLGEVATAVEGATAEAGRRGGAADESGPSIFDDILAALTAGNDAAATREAREAAATGAASRDTPAARGGARTVQDFRYSRFDITQRFAEGFDPDRIAVAFADDLGSIGSQRLQSGLEPVFGIR